MQASMVDPLLVLVAMLGMVCVTVAAVVPNDREALEALAKFIAELFKHLK